MREDADLSTLSRDVNLERERVGRALLGGSGSPLWLFRCECGAPDCDAEIELTLEEFARARGKPGELLLARGHALTRAQAARREARRLADEASALRAQSEQILRHSAQRPDTPS